ncbi:MAG: nitroreductase, partial [Pseudomonadota bacterium]
VCYNLLLAASAAGYAGQWLSEWVAYDPHIYKAMGLEANEKIAGLIYLGTAEANPKERARPEALSLTTKWSSTD